MSTQDITAPLSGKVIDALVQEGSEVSEDQEIFIIEAMKMETMVYAPCSGTITSVKVKGGDNVEEEDIIAVIQAG